MKARQTGIALILVLWVLTLLTVMAVSLTATQRTETALAESAISAARFRASADAAIAYSVLRLTQPIVNEDDADMVWLPDGQPHLWHFDGQELQIRIRDEAALIDLNRASQELLSALLTLVDVPADEANALAAAILDWRDSDDLALLAGAEDDDYRAAGAAFGAADRPFRSIEELNLVRGMTPEVYARLAPELSIASGEATPRTRFASPLVLAAVQGISLEQARDEIEARQQGLFEDERRGLFTERGGPVYRIELSVLEQQRATQTLEAVVDTSREHAPYRVRQRRFGLAHPSGERAEQSP